MCYKKLVSYNKAGLRPGDSSEPIFTGILANCCKYSENSLNYTFTRKVRLGTDCLPFQALPEYRVKTLRIILGVDVGHDAKLVVVGPETVYLLLAVLCGGQGHDMPFDEGKLSGRNGLAQFRAVYLLALYTESVHEAASAHDGNGLTQIVETRHDLYDLVVECAAGTNILFNEYDAEASEGAAGIW